MRAHKPKPDVPSPRCPNCDGCARRLNAHDRECDHCGLTYIADSVTWCPTGEALAWPKFAAGGSST
jgi:hypothetical protein